jgi:hypothetical protein
MLISYRLKWKPAKSEKKKFGKEINEKDEHIYLGELYIWSVIKDVKEEIDTLVRDIT